jgi:hypothetical protein
MNVYPIVITPIEKIVIATAFSILAEVATTGTAEERTDGAIINILFRQKGYKLDKFIDIEIFY